MAADGLIEDLIRKPENTAPDPAQLLHTIRTGIRKTTDIADTTGTDRSTVYRNLS